MLVLSRKRSESIVIDVDGTQINVMVIEIRGDKVRLGVEAPRKWGVHRDEVWARMHAGDETPPHPAGVAGGEMRPRPAGVGAP